MPIRLGVAVPAIVRSEMLALTFGATEKSPRMRRMRAPGPTMVICSLITGLTAGTISPATTHGMVEPGAALSRAPNREPASGPPFRDVTAFVDAMKGPTKE